MHHPSPPRSHCRRATHVSSFQVFIAGFGVRPGNPISDNFPGTAAEAISERDELEPIPAAWTREDVEAETSLHQLRPQPVGAQRARSADDAADSGPTAARARPETRHRRDLPRGRPCAARHSSDRLPSPYRKTVRGDRARTGRSETGRTHPPGTRAQESLELFLDKPRQRPARRRGRPRPGTPRNDRAPSGTARPVRAPLACRLGRDGNLRRRPVQGADAAYWGGPADRRICHVPMREAGHGCRHDPLRIAVTGDASGVGGAWAVLRSAAGTTIRTSTRPAITLGRAAST